MSNSTKKAAEQAEREKVKRRYANRREPDVIYPAKKQVDFYDDAVHQRVAVYVRVSTDNLGQETSYELQKNYYEEFVLKHPNWALVKIYADKGISGTSTRHRDELNQMLTDCRSGKIDLIITKSVSRLARNTVDCITMVRNLAELRNPVGVFFESVCIFSLNEDTLGHQGGTLMQDFSRFVPNVHFEQIPIKNLVSNQEYQRPLSQTQVEKAIEDFDLNQINPVKVSRRDGINYVFNGQHTIEIVAAVSGSRETPVWCMIYDSLDYRNEADIFANQMKHVRPLKPYEIFMANIEAGNEQQLVIKRLVESYSLTLGPNKGYGVICAIATLERIYTKYGYHVLDRTLRLCVGTWEGDIDSLGGNILAGVARLVVAFGDQLRDETFKEKVGFMSVRQLSRIAKERGAGSLGFAEAMLVAYNRKCKYTLRMTKLHSGRVAEEGDFVDEPEEPLPDTPVLEV